MKFYVEVAFKKGPSFSIQQVEANSYEVAKALAVSDAKKFGFSAQIKKVHVRKL